MSEDLDLRRSIQEAFARLPTAEVPPDAVLRRARTLRLRKVLTIGSVTLLLAASLVIPVGLLWPIGGSGPAVSSIAEFGLRLDLPAGWDSRISYLRGTPGPRVEAASFALPSPGPDSLYLATRSMGPDDIVLSLHDFTGACPCSGFEASELPIDIRASDFQSWRGLDEGRSFAQRSIQVNGRFIDVWVEFGSDPAPEALRTEVNTILASLKVATSAGAPTQPDAHTWKPPTFEPAGGWSTVSTGPVPVGSEGLSVTWASNVPFHAQDLRDSAQVGQLVFTPRETMRALPPDGVVLVTDLPLPDKLPATPGPNFPERELPLQLSDAEVQQQWEGQVAPNVPFYWLQGVVNDQYVEVRVFFGTQDPSPETLRAAQEELDRLLVPESGTGQVSAAPSPTPPGASGAVSDVRLPDDHSASRLAVGEGALWALASSNRAAPNALVRIDPATGQVLATTPLEAEPWYVAAGGGAVWIGSPNSSTVQRVDPATNEVTARIELPGDGVSAIAADARAVWVEVIQDRSDQGKQNLASLLRIDPSSNEVVATIPLEGSSGYDDEIASGAGAVWVAGVNLTGPSEERGADLVRIDPTTNTIATVVPVSAFSVRAGADAVWITTPADGVNDSLHKPEAWVAEEIDPATNEVTSPIQLPGNVSAVLAATADGVWFAGYDGRGRIHPVHWRNGAFDASVPPIDSVYTDMAFDDGSGTIWIAAVSGLKRIDLASLTR
jgi:hypothetical protein